MYTYSVYIYIKNTLKISLQIIGINNYAKIANQLISWNVECTCVEKSIFHCIFSAKILQKNKQQTMMRHISNFRKLICSWWI